MKKSVSYVGTRKWARLLKKSSVRCELSFHSMAADTSKNGKAELITRMEDSFVLIDFSYEKELGRTRWNSVRKGAAYSVYMGWLFFVTYIIYSVGFIFGSILMSYKEQTEINISDVLVVSS